MKFEWDSDKSSSNKSKHGIDFDTAKELWLDENRIEIHAPYPLEDRWIVIGKLQKKIWISIYTIRNEAIRIISVRRARKKEVELYEKNG
ncbi:MAG: BrnT family toxin [Deltaproteobacteria bacterium]|nr:BrnT family toxin [Deltaproteobacteria bacterium]MBI3753352.1 BrnT family toxin [Deltaproteobacteria bacterium]